MEHKRVDQLRSVADVACDLPKTFMTRREKLERWAELLERDSRRRLHSLGEIEFQPRDTRHLMRADDSPLSVAYADPVLRAAGLTGDRLGEGMDFFDLSEGDAHRVLCSCMNGRTMESGLAARRVRAIANYRTQALYAIGIAAGAITTLPVLAYIFG